jgi:20S proteasome alpha/beta subunit
MSRKKPKAYITGTSVVVMRSPSEIVIGADSLFFATKRDDSYEGTTCKIAQIGESLFFSASGLIGDSYGDFSVHRLAVEACQENRIIADKIRCFESNVQSPIVKALEDIREKQIHPVLEGV